MTYEEFAIFAKAYEAHAKRENAAHKEAERKLKEEKSIPKPIRRR